MVGGSSNSRILLLPILLWSLKLPITFTHREYSLQIIRTISFCSDCWWLFFEVVVILITLLILLDLPKEEMLDGIPIPTFMEGDQSTTSVEVAHLVPIQITLIQHSKYTWISPIVAPAVAKTVELACLPTLAIVHLLDIRDPHAVLLFVLPVSFFIATFFLPFFINFLPLFVQQQHEIDY